MAHEQLRRSGDGIKVDPGGRSRSTRGQRRCGRLTGRRGSRSLGPGPNCATVGADNSATQHELAIDRDRGCVDGRRIGRPAGGPRQSRSDGGFARLRHICERRRVASQRCGFRNLARGPTRHLPAAVESGHGLCRVGRRRSGNRGPAAHDGGDRRCSTPHPGGVAQDNNRYTGADDLGSGRGVDPGPRTLGLPGLE